jgi:hypothetical protein
MRRLEVTPSLVISLLALFEALSSGAYAATGGNFILGQANTATSKTSLTGRGGAPALQVTNNSAKLGATALALYTDHLAEHPGDTAIFAALAELQLNLGRTETAQELWTELLTRNPNDAMAASRLALLCERNGEFADALAYVTRAERVFSKDPEMAFVRIRAAMREGDDARAVELLEVIRNWEMTDGQARLAAHYRGRMHDRADEVPQAVAYWCDSQRDIPGAIHAQDAVPAALLQPAGPLPAAPESKVAAPVFLLGLPGSEVERVAALLMEQPSLRVLRDRALAPLRLDDFSQPDFAAFEAGLSSQDAAQRRARYGAERERLGEPGAARDIDWLMRWDARFIPLLRAAFPDATVVVVERDPRDLLLTWLGFGWMPGFPLSDPMVGAGWLARAQAHLDALAHSGLNVVRVNADAVLDDPVGAGAELAKAVGLAQLDPGRAQLGLGGLVLGLPAGRWIAYADVLGPAFAQLVPQFV